MDDDGGVGDVEEPEGVVEAEAGEEVAGCEVAEGGVAHAAAQHVEDGGDGGADEAGFFHCFRFRRRGLHRVLDFDEDDRERVGEGDVAERLEAPPYLLCLSHGSDAYSGQAALYGSVSCLVVGHSGISCK